MLRYLCFATLVAGASAACGTDNSTTLKSARWYSSENVFTADPVKDNMVIIKAHNITASLNVQISKLTVDGGRLIVDGSTFVVNNACGAPSCNQNCASFDPKGTCFAKNICKCDYDTRHFATAGLLQLNNDGAYGDDCNSIAAGYDGGPCPPSTSFSIIK
jgi:hypothetical protein